MPRLRRSLLIDKLRMQSTRLQNAACGMCQRPTVGGVPGSRAALLVAAAPGNREARERSERASSAARRGG